MQQIDERKIDIASGERPDTELDRLEMANSIKELGLLQPLNVVPSAEHGDRYTVINGRRRLGAIRLLGWQWVDCIIRDYAEIDQELAEIAENLHRKDLTTSQRDYAMRRYRTLYEVKHPEAKGRVEVAQGKNLGHAVANGAAQAEPPPKPTLAAATKAVARAFRVSPRTVQAAIKRTETLTALQRTALEKAGIVTIQVDQIAAIADHDHREQAVNLVVAGMPFKDVLANVLGKEHIPDPEVPVQTAVDDAAFLASCPVRPSAKQERFDADALLYLHIQAARIAFQRAINWSGLKAKVGPRGPYFRRLMYLLEAKHPREWLQCGRCLQGVTRDGECQTCKGTGYQIG